MIMLYGIGTAYPVLDPEGLSGTLASGTMTIAATIVTDIFKPTLITPVYMSAQSRSPACRQSSQNTELTGVWSVFLDELLTKDPDNISDFVFGAAHKASL
jgi:hypothetical protein